MSDAYPSCFYLPESCPQPCAREEYAWCPLNPEVERAPVVSPERVVDPEVEERVKLARFQREEMRVMGDPHMREITENLRRVHSSSSKLVCPSCGEGDHGNRMNKKPWCMRCNMPLMTREQAEGWVKPGALRRFPRGVEVEDVCRV